MKIGLISLGCPKNLVDSEVMLGLLARAGHEITNDPAQAEAIIVSTCSFISLAREEAAQAIEEMACYRRAGPCRRLIVAGCWPRHEGVAHLRGRFPDVDAFVGPDGVARIVETVAGAQARGPSAAPRYLYDHTAPRLRATPPWTAYLKIADGCNHRCSFCVIPGVRGHYRSRELDSVAAEAEALAAAGVREIVLVAQDTTAYGLDRYRQRRLPALLARLAEIAALKWIRVLYAYPALVSDELLEALASHERICKYLDVPFQHAHPEMLRAMRRPGDADAYLRLIERMRARVPEIAIRTSLLVGFPGESEAHFEALLRFVERAQFDRAGVFRYSPEKGTAAAALPGRVPEEVVEERYDRLMTLQQEISLERNKRWVERTIEVLVEATDESGAHGVGRSFRDAPDIDGTVKVDSKAPLRRGAFVPVRIAKALPYDLAGMATLGAKGE
jgi:ribosomal protein S12 methylthiotransferase